MKEENLNIFESPEILAIQFASQLMNWIENHPGQKFNLAISGGRTPDLLFSFLAERYAHSSCWNKVHFWWVDERMVLPTSPESNFGVAERLFFSKVAIPDMNIHRIKGENNPEEEAQSYSAQILENIETQAGWPVFDTILLGMGDDGHTASIFPNQMSLLDSDKNCAVAIHPVSGQKRVTLTGNVINNSQKVCFLVTGQNKATRICEILTANESALALPAFYIHPKNSKPAWYLDMQAASLLPL